MTYPAATPVPVASHSKMPLVIRSAVERLLPWYDQAEMKRHDAHTLYLLRLSLVANERAERARLAYLAASERLGR